MRLRLARRPERGCWDFARASRISARCPRNGISRHLRSRCLAPFIGCALTTGLLQPPTWAANAPDAPAAAPAEEARVLAGRRALLSSVEIHGNQAISSDELDELATEVIGQSVGLDEIEGLRHRISTLYAERGYINSGAVYESPPIREGVLYLRVIEGRISGFELSGNERLAETYVKNRLYREEQVLNVAALQERYELLLADPLFSRLSVRLQPGQELGEARLLVDVERARPWQVSAYANNHHSVSTGENMFGVAGLVRNLSGHGDVLDAFVQFTKGAHRSGAGWKLPLGARGPIVSLRYEDGDASVVEEPLDKADIESKVQSFDVGLEQVLVDRLDMRLSLGLQHSERRNTTTVFGEPFSFIAGEPSGINRVRALRFSQEFMRRTRETVLALRSTFSVGNTNTTRDESDDALEFPARDFQHWVGQAQYIWRPGGRAWHIKASAVAQKAQDRLVPLEQFALGGVATVRGYRGNSLVRDNGHAMGLSFHLPLSVLGLENWEVSIFHERGAAWNRNEEHRQLRSTGVGLRYQQHGWHFEMSWAYRIDPRTSVERNGLQDRGIHVALTCTY